MLTATYHEGPHGAFIRIEGDGLAKPAEYAAYGYSSPDARARECMRAVEYTAGFLERQRRDEAEQADKARRFDDLRGSLLAALDEVAALYVQSGGHALMNLAARARRYRSRLVAVRNTPADHSPVSGYGPLGDWGPNGHAPAIYDILASARFHAERRTLAPAMRVAA